MEMVYGKVYRHPALPDYYSDAGWKEYATCSDPAEAAFVASRCAELDGHYYYGWIDEQGRIFEA